MTWQRLICCITNESKLRYHRNTSIDRKGIHWTKRCTIIPASYKHFVCRVFVSKMFCCLVWQKTNTTSQNDTVKLCLHIWKWHRCFPLLGDQQRLFTSLAGFVHNQQVASNVMTPWISTRNGRLKWWIKVCFPLFKDEIPECWMVLKCLKMVQPTICDLRSQEKPDVVVKNLLYACQQELDVIAQSCKKGWISSPLGVRKGTGVYIIPSGYLT